MTRLFAYLRTLSLFISCSISMVGEAREHVKRGETLTSHPYPLCLRSFTIPYSDLPAPLALPNWFQPDFTEQSSTKFDHSPLFWQAKLKSFHPSSIQSISLSISSNSCSKLSFSQFFVVSHSSELENAQLGVNIRHCPHYPFSLFLVQFTIQIYARRGNFSAEFNTYYLRLFDEFYLVSQ